MAIINFSIRVVDEDGEGVSGKRVTVHYDLTIDEDYTNDDGWVEFGKDNMLEPSAKAAVYIDSDNVGDINAYNGDTFSFAVD
ncbi:hypothetical protein HYR53_01715 [Candidatus Acetothermia bacterium]|nr:hypothetical protein [Candidatus Acetothermia bacterium]